MVLFTETENAKRETDNWSGYRRIQFGQQLDELCLDKNSGICKPNNANLYYVIHRINNQGAQNFKKVPL